MTAAPTTATVRHAADADDRAALVRALTAWTGDPSTADDLAQETLVAAWTSNRQPRHAEEWRPWLFGVARNVLLRWRRDMAKHGRRVASSPESERHLLAAAVDDDLDALLRREDIVDLLDTALGRLPAETRQALLLKYIDDLPQAEIAARMGVHEKALEGRLHRGKRAIHRHLLTERADSAVALGLIAEPDAWVETDIWCPVCGQRHLHGRRYESGHIRLDCSACDGWLRPGERSHFMDGRAGTSGDTRRILRGSGPSFRVTMIRIADEYSFKLRDGLDSAWPCSRCGGTVRPRRVVSADDPEGEYGPEVRHVCSTCGLTAGHSYIPGSGYLHPLLRAWNERHERIRLLQPRQIELNGRHAIETTWESLSGAGAAVTIHDLATLKMVRAVCDGIVALDREPV